MNGLLQSDLFIQSGEVHSHMAKNPAKKEIA